MFVSLNWIRDFVDLPTDLDARALAERFTVTTAEVEGVEKIACEATGLIAGEILSVQPMPESAGLFAARINTGSDKFDTVTAAESLKRGDRVIFAPPGASLPGIGKVAKRKVAGTTSTGMIVSGDALSLPTVGQRALWLPAKTKPGTPIDMSLFSDWIIEIDNKSITHRPDLWGHYGIAREMAAIYATPLKIYPVTPIEEIASPQLPEIPIVIDDPAKCPRYSALRFTGVRSQPAPLWMQVRLAHVGLRPIDILVDLTNYIMLELGQPMHAFDCATIDRIEVATAKPSEKFTTLDGTVRTMPAGALMIQCNRTSVALAGIMGGAETEVTERTESLLLESANFNPVTIRRCASALGHRTDASARFEKSLDPKNTVLAIQRFVHLACPELPDMKLTSRLSDNFPQPPATTVVRVDPDFVSRYMGRPIAVDTIRDILTALEFKVDQVGHQLDVAVPTFRATKDISIEADIIEEVARFVGYGSIEPVLPVVTVRYAEPARITQLEKQTLILCCGGLSYNEIHRHVWFDTDWLATLGYDPPPTVTIRNPVAAGTERLRTTLIPGMLAAVDLNRHYVERFELLEIGSVFFPDSDTAPSSEAPGGSHERRHMSIALAAPGRKTVHEDALLSRLKTDLETWSCQILGSSLQFGATEPLMPWEHDVKTTQIYLDKCCLGRMTVVPAAAKRRIDEHLLAWSIALAEIDLSVLHDRQPRHRKLAPVPVYPQIELDFSVIVDGQRHYAEIEDTLAHYRHPLLRRLSFADSYEGGSIPAGKRSLTFRAMIGDPSRTLTEEDIQGFRSAFIDFLEKHDLDLRT